MYNRFEDEILGLPLAGVESIIASDDLRVNSEDEVYSFVLKWAYSQYPTSRTRREIIATRLVKFIRFPYMTCTTLTQVLNCKDFEGGSGSNFFQIRGSTQATYIYDQC